MKKKFYRYQTIASLFLSGFLINTQEVLARGGGGGSGGGGGGGSYGAGGSDGSGGPVVFAVVVVFIIAVIIFKIFLSIRQKKIYRQEQADIIKKENLNLPEFRAVVEELFYKFETAWGKFDLSTLERILIENYYKRMVLELSVLQNEKRANPMSNLLLQDAVVVAEEPGQNGGRDLVVKITASATDQLMDTESNRQLFVDRSSFTEYWHLARQGNVWKLNLITQATENPALVEGDIAEFAKTNNFYFDPDFGWLMMPNKGVLFSQTDFGRADINNHVIGYFRGKIVEFYTYIPNTNSKNPDNYLVAQAILPKTYFNILIKRKHWMNFAAGGLKRMELESAEFNEKFCLWADERDQINSLELLTPNFMEKIYGLPFELDIELVGNFLYFYTKQRGAANYPQMLQVLSWAFDEMKM